MVVLSDSRTLRVGVLDLRGVACSVGPLVLTDSWTEMVAV